MWMAQKCYLKQDMFLLGDPGPHLRNVALQFAARTGREVEYIGITRDTTEADLMKQRREICDGELQFHNAPAVEAALRGRLLILEGVQKAERNVLPLLNNLLENREMSLEDGSFLMAPGREKEIREAAQGGRRLLPVSKNFLVIALGLPVPPYPGTALDPPLRSRFAAKRVPGDVAASAVEKGRARTELLKRWKKPRAARAKEQIRLPRFPEFGLLSVMKLLKLFPALPEATALHSAFPWNLLPLSAAQRTGVQAALKMHQLELPSASGEGYNLKEVEKLQASPPTLCTPHEATGDCSALCPCGATGPAGGHAAVLARLAPVQRAVLGQMLRDHAAGMDLCLVGERGVGKTALSRAFAEVLGYRTYTVFCFKERDMTARDLTLRRSTDERGNTTWQPSPLIQAALEGGLAVLDGVHRLPGGALAGAVGRLLTDREGALPDGTRLVPQEQWDQWLERGWSTAALCAEGFRPVHPAFRVVATAEPATANGSGGDARCWLEEELLTLFHFTEVVSRERHGDESSEGPKEAVCTHVKPLPAAQQVKLAAQLCGLSAEHKVLNGLMLGLALAVFRMAYGKALRAAAKSDVSLQPLVLSLRQLLHLARRLSASTASSSVEAEVVKAALSGYVHFLPPLSKQAVLRMMREAMAGVGVKVNLEDAEELKDLEAQRKAQLAEERGERLKALEEPAIGLRFMPNPSATRHIDEETQKLRDEAHTERRQKHEALLRTARNAAAGAAAGQRGALKVEDAEVRLGNVSCKRGRPQRPELVPSTLFVDIPQHVAMLRTMLIDWLLQRHLLLIGNQGVGKNKLADRFLSMLRLEREYLQLHRDTSVQSLTCQPVLQDGKVVYQDSPLVSAVRYGRVLVIDEADKAPLEVVCILKSLAEDGEFSLADGRTIMKPEHLSREAAHLSNDCVLPIAAGFRMIVLANRPGYPFLGNDFYRECGDVFASHAIDNPDVPSEVELLRSYGPSVPQEQLVRLLGLFAELRRLVEEGMLSYPYSTRELVKIVRHLENFPDDPVEEVFGDVFEFDWHDSKLRETLAGVLHGCPLDQTSDLGSSHIPAAADKGGFEFNPTAKPVKHGDAQKRLPKECGAKWGRDDSDFPRAPNWKDFKSAKHYDSGENENDGEGFDPGDVGTRDYDDATDQSGKRHAPRAGNWDGRQHIGEGPWDGGSGGTGTAGIGGRAGPYRLDVGQELVMLTEEQKKEVSEEWHKKAQQMADEAYAHRLKELKMSAHDETEYRRLREAVEAQIAAFRLVLESHEAKERERSWQKQQVQGELDEMRLVDGLVGARNIYRRRGEADRSSGDQLLPKRIKFVMDCSGSMYTFNRIDQRLQRLMEASIFIFESFQGFEQKYQYSMVGHSGSGPEAENLVSWGKPPRSAQEQLAIVKQMAAHAQYSHSGDHTLQATDRAIKDGGSRDVVRTPADEYYVFVVSDADLGRYGIDKRVNAYVILISSNTDEAETFKSGLLRDDAPQPSPGPTVPAAARGRDGWCGRAQEQLQQSEQVILVASHAKAGSAKGTVRPELLRGPTEDPAMDWVTMGYPQLAQASGKYYFEVNLIEGAEAPQVGLASKEFRLQPGAPSTQGVGDCEYSWAVDGQSAIRWHRGEALVWGQTWPSQEGTRRLSAAVTVGVAVDLDQRCFYFSTDGQWDEKWWEFPAFNKDMIPAGREVFPVVSLKGRASFDFGP
ncbi:von Willebrand factor A domain-containing protein 8 (PEX7-binding protein 2) (P7BP2), partial [Durusdinium trenchii]